MVVCLVVVGVVFICVSICICVCFFYFCFCAGIENLYVSVCAQFDYKQLPPDVSSAVRTSRGYTHVHIYIETLRHQ